MIERRDTAPGSSLGDRLTNEARRLLSEAESLPPGPERDELLRKAFQFETASHMNEWLSAPGPKSRGKFTDADNAKRFRDKAAEALQLIDLAETESRRIALRHIVDHYNRVAEQLENLGNALGQSKT